MCHGHSQKNLAKTKNPENTQWGLEQLMLQTRFFLKIMYIGGLGETGENFLDYPQNLHSGWQSVAQRWPFPHLPHPLTLAGVTIQLPSCSHGAQILPFLTLDFITP